MAQRWLQRALGVLLAASAAADAAATSAPAHLGPGRGAWRVESPLKHGISPESMQRAAELIRTRAAQRYCLVVVKDGAIIHESYYANTSESVYETDSMAKTFTAALLGVACGVRGAGLAAEPYRGGGAGGRAVGFAGGAGLESSPHSVVGSLDPTCARCARFALSASSGENSRNAASSGKTSSKEAGPSSKYLRSVFRR